MPVIDHTGIRFGKLVAIMRIAQTNERTKYLCKCDCGNEVVVLSASLACGHSNTCGCSTKKHGKANKERLYVIWKGIKQRCYNPNSHAYDRYGGRGIDMDEAWKNDYSLFREWALKNGYNDALSIDRINVNEGYFPSNCKWSNDYQQANNKRSNKLYEFNGLALTLPQWSRKMNIHYGTLKSRIDDYGWDIQRALLTPVKGGV